MTCEPTRSRKTANRLALLFVSALAAVLVACGADQGPATAGDCSGEVTTGIAPGGSGADAYTMLLRVNTEAQVSQFAADPLRSRILDRDIFVINTEYDSMKPGQAEQILGKLRKEFPCNRVASLNGLLRAPGEPGYMFALAGEPGLNAVILDWESSTWSEARDGPWSDRAAVNLVRMRRELEALVARIEKAPGTPETRVALATQFRSGWDYALFARGIALVNWQLNRDFRGYQIVQSQDRCGGSADSVPLVEVTRRLLAQYRSLANGEPGPDGWQKSSQSQEEMLNHLGFEVSFSDDPKPGDPLPAGRDSSGDAATCTEDVLDAGGAAFIYWATPEDVKSMLDTDAGRNFRPPDQS